MSGNITVRDVERLAGTVTLTVGEYDGLRRQLAEAQAAVRELRAINVEPGVSVGLIHALRGELDKQQARIERLEAVEQGMREAIALGELPIHFQAGMERLIAALDKPQTGYTQVGNTNARDVLYLHGAGEAAMDND